MGSKLRRSPGERRGEKTGALKLALIVSGCITVSKYTEWDIIVSASKPVIYRHAERYTLPTTLQDNSYGFFR
jgi:hypothetical protein